MRRIYICEGEDRYRKKIRVEFFLTDEDRIIFEVNSKTVTANEAEAALDSMLSDAVSKWTLRKR